MPRHARMKEGLSFSFSGLRAALLARVKVDGVVVLCLLRPSKRHPQHFSVIGLKGNRLSQKDSD